MVSVLDDPLLQHFALLRGDIISEARIDQWLAMFFDTQLQLLEEHGQASKTLVEILEKVLQYTRRTKVDLTRFCQLHSTRLIYTGLTTICRVFYDKVSSTLGRSGKSDLNPQHSSIFAAYFLPRFV